MDSLRALAVLSVLIFHLTLEFAYTYYPTHGLRPLARHLDVSVTIFFMISAFLLYRPWVAAHAQGRPGPRLLPYAMRRVARIVPAYWVALTIVGVVLGIGDVFSLHGLLHYYAFAQIYRARTALGGLGVAWTLCVEVVLYVALPLFGWAALRIAARARLTALQAHSLLVAILFALGFAYQVVAVSQADPNLYAGASAVWFLPFPGFLDQFALGMALAVWSVAASAGAPRARRARDWLGQHPSLPGLVALAMFVTISFAYDAKGLPLSGMTGLEWIGRHESYGLMAMLLLMGAVLPGPARGIVQRSLAWKPLRLIGVVSYGIYLFHSLIVRELEIATRGTGLHPNDIPSKIAFTAITLAAVIAAGTLSYLLIERPARRLARRMAPPRVPAVRAEAPMTTGG